MSAKAIRYPVPIEAHLVVRITENGGGYMAGYCQACRQGGWVKGAAGLPWRAGKSAMKNHLIHTEACPMNRLITRTGYFRAKPLDPAA